MENYLIIIEKGQNNYSAYCPDVLGCAATGKSVEETIKRMKEAMYMHLEDIFKRGEPIPDSKGLEYHRNEIDKDSGDLFTFLRVEISPSTIAA